MLSTIDLLGNSSWWQSQGHVVAAECRRCSFVSMQRLRPEGPARVHQDGDFLDHSGETSQAAHKGPCVRNVFFCTGSKDRDDAGWLQLALFARREHTQHAGQHAGAGLEKLFRLAPLLRCTARNWSCSKRCPKQLSLWRRTGRVCGDLIPECRFTRCRCWSTRACSTQCSSTASHMNKISACGFC